MSLNREASMTGNRTAVALMIAIAPGSFFSWTTNWLAMGSSAGRGAVAGTRALILAGRGRPRRTAARITW